MNLTVPAGSVVGLIGSNGAGKTTLIKAMLGVIRPSGGRIVLFGEDTAAISSARFAELKQQVGVVLDSCSFPEELTVGSIGRVMARTYRSWDHATFERHCAAFALPADKTVKDLSRGMGMKLSLACALSHDAKLLVLDEATAGLDPIARDEVLDILRTYMADESCGILMSSHITSDLEKIADYVVCIDGGREVFAVEKDAITDLAGVMLARATEFEALVQSGLFEPGTLRYERTPYHTRVLVPDRALAAEHFPGAIIERADIDAYMHLMLKGTAL